MKEVNNQQFYLLMQLMVWPVGNNNDKMWDENDDVGDDVTETHQHPDIGDADWVICQEIHGAGQKVALDK